jgi:hypothetical protein
MDTGDEEASQITLGDHMTPARHLRADELAALMVYQAGLPFGFFEKPEVLAFLPALNSAYIPPKRDILATIMLDKAWESVKGVDAEIDKEDELNNCVDGPRFVPGMRRPMGIVLRTKQTSACTSLYH